MTPFKTLKVNWPKPTIQNGFCSKFYFYKPLNISKHCPELLRVITTNPVQIQQMVYWGQEVVYLFFKFTCSRDDSKQNSL